MRRLNIGLKPHKAQIRVLNSKKDIIVVAASRRFGKTALGKLAVLRASLDFDNYRVFRGLPPLTIDPAMPAVVAVAAPTREMAKELWFKPIKAMLEGHPVLRKLIKKVNESRLSIDFYGNRPGMIFGGADFQDGDNWRGLKMVFAVLDEVQDISFESITKSFKPALADSQGALLCLGTPKGKNNTLGYLHDLAIANPDIAEFYRFTYADNPYLDPKVIENERKFLTDLVFAQEFMASFISHPAKFFTELTDDNLIETKDLPKSFDYTAIGVDHGQLWMGYVVLGISNHKAYVLEAWKSKGKVPVTQKDFHSLIADAVDRLDNKRFNLSYIVGDSSEPATIMAIRASLNNSKIPVRSCWKEQGSVAIGQGIVHTVIQQRQLLFPKEHLFSGRPVLDQGSYLNGCEVYDFFHTYNRKVDKKTGVVQEEEESGHWELIDATRYILAKDPSLARLLINQRRQDVYYSQLMLSPEQYKYMMDDDPRLAPNSPTYDPRLAMKVNKGLIELVKSTVDIL